MTLAVTTLKLSEVKVDEEAFGKLEVKDSEIAPFSHLPGINIVLMKGPSRTSSHYRRWDEKDETAATNLYSYKWFRDTVIPCNVSYIVALGNPIWCWADYIGNESHNWQKFSKNISWSYLRYKGHVIVTIIKKDDDGNLTQRTQYLDGERINQVHILHHVVSDGFPCELQKDPKKVKLLHDMLCETVKDKESKDAKVTAVHCAAGIGRTGDVVSGALNFVRHSDDLVPHLPSDLPGDPVQLVKWVRTKSGRTLFLADLARRNNIDQFKDGMELARALEEEHLQYLSENKPRPKVSDLVQLTKDEEKAVFDKVKTLHPTPPLNGILFIFDIDKIFQEQIFFRFQVEKQFLRILQEGGEVAIYCHPDVPNYSGMSYITWGVAHSSRVEESKREKNQDYVHVITQLVEPYHKISRVVLIYGDKSVESHFPAITSSLKGKEFSCYHYVDPKQFSMELDKYPLVCEQKNDSKSGSQETKTDIPVPPKTLQQGTIISGSEIKIAVSASIASSTAVVTSTIASLSLSAPSISITASTNYPKQSANNDIKPQSKNEQILRTLLSKVGLTDQVDRILNSPHTRDFIALSLSSDEVKKHITDSVKQSSITDRATRQSFRLWLIRLMQEQNKVLDPEKVRLLENLNSNERDSENRFPSADPTTDPNAKGEIRKDFPVVNFFIRLAASTTISYASLELLFRVLPILRFPDFSPANETKASETKDKESKVVSYQVAFYQMAVTNSKDEVCYFNPEKFSKFLEKLKDFLAQDAITALQNKNQEAEAYEKAAKQPVAAAELKRSSAAKPGTSFSLSVTFPAAIAFSSRQLMQIILQQLLLVRVLLLQK